MSATSTTPVTICAECDHCKANPHNKPGSAPYQYICLRSKTTYTDFVTGIKTDSFTSCKDRNKYGRCHWWAARSPDKEPIPT